MKGKKMKKLTLLITIFTLLLFVGCSNSSTDGAISLTDAEKVTADKAALVITYGGSNTDIGVSQDLTLPTTGSNGSTITWSSNTPANIANNGTINRPSGFENIEVVLTATIEKNGESDTKIFTLTVSGTAIADIYVATTGDDTTGDGTVGTPYATIQKAILEATSGQKIAVAAGTYFATTTAINLKSGVSLYGSYSADFSTRNNLVRDHATYKTVIETGGSSATILDSETLANTTILDGFYISLTDVSSAYGMNLDNSGTEIVIQNNTFDAGDTRDETFDAISVGACSPKIENNLFKKSVVNTGAWAVILRFTSIDGSTAQILNNTIYGADVSDNSYVISFKGNGAITNAIVKGNTLYGGEISTANSYVVYGNQATGYTVEGNTITIGSSTSNSRDVSGIYVLQKIDGGTNQTKIFNNTIKSGKDTLGGIFGIQVSSSFSAGSLQDALIYNNTVLLSHAADTRPGYFGAIGILANGSPQNPTIDNNLISITSSTPIKTGISEKNGSEVVFGTGNYIYLGGATTDSHAGASDANYSISIVDPELNIDDLKLTASTPNSILTGGNNFTSIFTIDKAGVTRHATDPWSIGAYIAP